MADVQFLPRHRILAQIAQLSIKLELSQREPIEVQLFDPAIAPYLLRARREGGCLDALCSAGAPLNEPGGPGQGGSRFRGEGAQSQDLISLNGAQRLLP